MKKSNALAAGATFWSALAACGLAVGCGGTPCEEAASKLTGECEFGAGFTVPGASGIVECKDELECRAECVIEADCQEVVENDPDSGYSKCIAGCS